MNAWLLRNLATGETLPTTIFTSDEQLLRLNTPEGFEPIPVIATAVEAQPVEVDPAYEEKLRRSLLRARIERLETSQARPLRALALDPTDATARAKLVAIETQIAALRAEL
jgi:hypothetical protein